MRNDKAYVPKRNAILSGKVFKGWSVCLFRPAPPACSAVTGVFGANGSDLFRRQFGVIVSFALAIVSTLDLWLANAGTSFGLCIMEVVSIGTRKDMVRIDTRWVVALVTGKHTLW